MVTIYLLNYHLVVVCHRLLRGFLERRKRLIVLLMIAFIAGVLFLSYFCPKSLCSSMSNAPSRFAQQRKVRTDSHQVRSTAELAPWSTVKVDLPPVDVEFSDEEVKRTFSFSADHDVLVFLHAQKTGGSTFERHLVRDTVAGVPAPCVCRRRRKRCDCGDSRGRQWLFSRYSSGWVCGLHADWTELHDCVPQYLDKHEGKRQRRFFFFVFFCLIFYERSYTLVYPFKKTTSNSLIVISVTTSPQAVFRPKFLEQYCQYWYAYCVVFKKVYFWFEVFVSIFWTRNLCYIATHLVVLLVLLLGQCSSKKPKAVFTSWIGMKFGRIVLQVNPHQLTRMSSQAVFHKQVTFASVLHKMIYVNNNKKLSYCCNSRSYCMQ